MAGREECRKGIRVKDTDKQVWASRYGTADTDKGDVRNMEIARNGAVW